MRGQIFGEVDFWELSNGKRESFLAEVSFLRGKVFWAKGSFFGAEVFLEKEGIFGEGEEYFGKVRCSFPD